MLLVVIKHLIMLVSIIGASII